ncbi:aspartyl/glutamyl-tRNA amidotransferase subunit A [Candidatus Woesebacteria bacterium]|nr:aspartyl/glutamyl-tRNA amidotransferase subunit A [Candidatus Woesebacteria bacterium]MCD8527426.1 aspartyl/glutamyl-tRNA amidotransferase subunit A [Candidatus Woesebacteria bacterium]
MSVALNELTLREAIDGIRAKQFSAAEVQQAVIATVIKKNPELNVYRDFHETATDENFAEDLAGVPIAVKDNILTPGLKTTASSAVLTEYMPHYEATLAKQIREAGAFVVGKTNLDAWAHGSSTETSAFGPTKNPLNPEYIPGGSSGGSAAAIAADMAIAAIGTETSGSILGPSAWCGMVGLKPTYGRVSRYGVIAMASSLDCPGPMTKTVEDAAIMLEYMAGQDKYDGTTSPTEVPGYRDFIGKDIKGLRIGVMYLDILDSDEQRAVYETAKEELRALGAIVEDVQAMNPEPAIGMYAVLQRSEVSSNLARFDGIRYGEGRDAFGEEAKRRIMLGTYTLSKGYAEKYYIQAQRVRSLFIQDFTRLFAEYDVLVSPTMPGYALKLGESKNFAFFGEMVDKMAEPRAAAGLPAVNVPCHRDPATNLSLGLAFTAPAFQEQLAIQVADAYERATNWNPWRKRQQEGA